MLPEILGPLLSNWAAPAIVYFIEIAITCGLVRLSQQLFSSGQYSFYIQELTCVLQLVVLAFENGILRAAYGDIGLAAGIFIATIICSKTFDFRVMTNLSATVHQYTRMQRFPAIPFLLHTLAQFGGGWCALQYVKLLWSLGGMDAYHKARLVEIVPGISDIKVGIAAAIFVEIGLTFLFRLVVHRIGGARSRDNILLALAAVGCTFMGLNYTGGYFNPSVAFAMQFGANDPFTFLLVFVLAPVVGAVLVGLFGDDIWRNMPSFVSNVF